MPAFIGGLAFIPALPPKFANLQILLVNNLFIQTIFRIFDFKIFRMVRESKILSTILFMVISSIIMGLIACTAGETQRKWLVLISFSTKLYYFHHAFPGTCTFTSNKNQINILRLGWMIKKLI